MLGLARRLYEAGVPLVIGTDELPGFALQRALVLHAAAGIPVPVVLRMATLDAACTMNLDGELGTIAPGMLADLIVVPGDPLTRLESLREVQLVVKNGVVYDPALLRRAAGLR